VKLKSVVFKILGVIIGIVCVVVGVSERSSIQRLQASGKTAIVAPIGEYTERTRKGSHTYTAEFTFETENGSKITKSKSFPKELLADFEAGTPVKVFYDPRDPAEFVFEKDEPSWFVVLAGVGMAIAALIFA